MATVVDSKILEICSRVTGKRPRAVIDQIIEKGFVTTEELQAMGYDHAPRAARDVRENGVPLETFSVRSDRTGRQIAAYRFADPSQIKDGRIGGRVAFSKSFKDALIAKYGSRDTVSGAVLEARYLQIDHRIPYQVAGDGETDERDLDGFMLLDASNQRAKSWSCENCENSRSLLDKSICGGCYWAYPEHHSHVAMKPIRRMDIIWNDNEVADFELLNGLAIKMKIPLQDIIKKVLKTYLLDQK